LNAQSLSNPRTRSSSIPLEICTSTNLPFLTQSLAPAISPTNLRLRFYRYASPRNGFPFCYPPFIEYTELNCYMPISVGNSVGCYQILAPIGAGGMGEVYRGRDLKLDREVAIKVLPAAVAHDPERLARFEREAKILASLNHPNIAQIYGIEEADGVRALVMELVPGTTLKGPLSIETTLHCAKQIAEALEAAHEKAIIHRDLKPANLIVTPEGVVKVLDFGLAATPNREQTSDPANSPTMTATQAGVILGTAAYMSPEQAAGKVVDKRSDIWSFGVVLYEMLTGERLFAGETVSHTLADVLRAPIDFDKLPKETPQAVRELVKRCLDRNVKTRLRDIGEARVAILNLGKEPGATIAAPASRFGWLAWGLASLFLLTAIVVSFVHFRETAPAEPVLDLSVSLPRNTVTGFVKLSPDGHRMVLWLLNGGKRQLWLRSLDSTQLQVLPGTDAARAPFWSPDGKSIGFFADGKLKTLPASGGPPQVLCDGTGLAGGGTWNRDGVILFSTSGVSDPIQRVNASGGACTVVTHPEGGSGHVHPEFLPDGKHFVFAVVRGCDETKRGLYAASLDDPTPRRLLGDVSSAMFAPSTAGKKHGYLLFLRGSDLMAQPFHAETLQLAGDPVRIATNASFSLNFPQIQASVSANGILVYVRNVSGTRRQLTWLDRSGKEISRVASVQDQRHVGLSPDGKTVATVRPNQGIWLFDVQRGGETRFTPGALSGGAPVWSPDGNLIAFTAGNGLYLKDATGGLKEELLFENGNLKTASDWSRDGRYLIYTEVDPKNQGDIWYLPDPLNKSSGKKPVKFQGTEAVESQGQISPDGQWLAYASNESGQPEVYVRPFPAGPGRWKVSAGRGLSREPRWRRDGKELFFLETDVPQRLMTVPVQLSPKGDFHAGAPQALFEFRGNGSVPILNAFVYAPSADGQRFLVNLEAANEEPVLNVVVNWEKAALGK
jgi:Tol biopolymer transport system component